MHRPTLVNYLWEKVVKLVSSMSDFKAKMHQIRFPLRVCSGNRWANLQLSPDPLPVPSRLTSKGREGRGGELERKWREKGGSVR